MVLYVTSILLFSVTFALSIISLMLAVSSLFASNHNDKIDMYHVACCLYFIALFCFVLDFALLSIRITFV